MPAEDPLRLHSPTVSVQGPLAPPCMHGAWVHEHHTLISGALTVRPLGLQVHEHQTLSGALTVRLLGPQHAGASCGHGAWELKSTGGITGGDW